MPRPPDSVREALLRRGVILEGTTVGWNVVEGVIAVSAGAIASSVALIGFGVDSFVETPARRSKRRSRTTTAAGIQLEVCGWAPPADGASLRS